jgi:hypothetical protein
MTAREKVAEVERQVLGGCTTFSCPFCGLETTPNEGILCCEPAADVILLTLEYVAFKEQQAVMNKVVDRIISEPQTPRMLIN